MARYWIAVASREHVQKGVAEGFAQVCHGKKRPLANMQKDDWVIYYSPTVTFKGKDFCQSFTAIGRIIDGEPFPFRMSQDFIPWRRNVSFEKAKEAKIQPLLARLRFISNKKHWGFPFRRGCFEITQQDFKLIAGAMGVPDA